MTLSRTLEKWRFWIRAHNRHGVHSPFVYRFLDEGLYRREYKKFPPQKRLLIALVDYMAPGKAMACDPQSRMAPWLRAERPDIRWEGLPTDLCICDTPGEELLAFLDRPELWDKDTSVFVGNLRKNHKHMAYWDRATRHPAVRVVLETYPAGLLLFRTQQAPQHFRIRI
ncbi:MAG: hypothetical protein R3252_05970 [Robiginitalea sp.]|nr:hypothetical protein [Robiginitalea sp.]